MKSQIVPGSSNPKLLRYPFYTIPIMAQRMLNEGLSRLCFGMGMV